MSEYSLDITVNLKNKEVDLEVSGKGELKDVGVLIEYALEQNGIKPGSWTSLAIGLVDTTAKKKPKLRLVS